MKIEFTDADGALSHNLPVTDVYLHPHYGQSAECIDDGVLEYAFDTSKRVAFPYIRRSIDASAHRGFYDIVSPYGYGGLSARDTTDPARSYEFRDAFLKVSRERGLVAEFLRLSPLSVHRALIESADVVEHRQTFGSYVEDPDEEFQQTSGQHRTACRKAMRLGVTVKAVDASTLHDQNSAFRRIYDATMERLDSRPSLRLQTPYFDRLCRLPESSIRVLEAHHESEVVAAAIFLVWGDRVHYHLSGSTPSGRALQATDLIIDHAVRSLADAPFYLHLGGGYQAKDPLADFKRRASSQVFQMSFTKLVVNNDVYHELAGERKTSFFPAYRGV